MVRSQSVVSMVREQMMAGPSLAEIDNMLALLAALKRKGRDEHQAIDDLLDMRGWVKELEDEQ